MAHLIESGDFSQRLRGVRATNLGTHTKLRILGGKRIAVEQRFLDRDRRPIGAQSAEALEVVDELLFRHVLSREDRPPLRLTATAMVVEDVAHRLPKVMIRSTSRQISRYALKQLRS